MSISKETLFAIQTLQTMSPEGTIMKLFTPRGDPEYLIVVEGDANYLNLSDNRDMDTKQKWAPSLLETMYNVDRGKYFKLYSNHR
jgi:hypothetical protein